MSGTMNGAPFARREFKFPVIRGSKFARVVIEAKSIVQAAIKAGKITPQKPGKCPQCAGQSASDDLLCLPCRGRLHSKGCREVRVYPIRSVLCACGTEFETRLPVQYWCSRECRLETKRRKNAASWAIEIPCVKCGTAFVRGRPQAKYCKRCSPYVPGR